MKELIWTSDTEFSVDGLHFKTFGKDKTTGSDHILLLKQKAMLTKLLDLYREEGVRRVFELGIYQGGSVLMLTEALELERMAALDISPPIEALDAIIAERGLGDRVRLTYDTSQFDRPKVEAALRASFKPGDIDLIIDDASHNYGYTRTSFEVAFPYLKPGGLFVIEDWGWAHWRGVWQTPQAQWREHPALSNLVFELVMAAATSPHLIEEVRVWGGAAIVRKGRKARPGQPMKLSESYALRGKKFPLI
jgi:predicted O-methyltransferase YrrM